MNKPYEILQGAASDQGSPEWLAYRRTKVTATDLPVLLFQMKKYGKTPQTLIHDKILGKEIVDNAMMKRGREQEPFAIATLSMDLNAILIPCVVQSKKFPWLMASLDGFDEDKMIVGEAKTPGLENLMNASLGILPDYWETQGQVALLVLDLPVIHFIVWRDPLTYYLVEVKEDKALQEKILEVSKSFYDILIQAEIKDFPDEGFAVSHDEKANDRLLLLKHEIRKLKEQTEIVDALKIECREYTDDGSCLFPVAGMKATLVSGRETTDWKKVQVKWNISELELQNYKKKGKDYFTFTEIKG